MSDKDFDTSELLSSLEKLKAKYSFPLDEDFKKDEVTIPEKQEIAAKDEAVSIGEALQDIEETTAYTDEVQPEPEVIYSSSNDTSWMLNGGEDGQDDTTVSEIQEIEPIRDEPIVEDTLDFIEEDPIKINEDDDNVTPWFLTTPEATQEESQEQQQDDIKQATIVSEPIIIEANPIADVQSNDKDDFSDLDDDDDLRVIRTVETDSKDSPFYAAFMQTTTDEPSKQKPPKPVKSTKPVKPAKEKKVKSEKSGKKISKKVILNIVVAVVLAVSVWACFFVTDILLVSKNTAPVFCAETQSYEDGSKTYTGAFYQIQLSKNDNGSYSSYVYPWLVKGANANK